MYAALAEYFCTHRMSAPRLIGRTGASVLPVADSAWDPAWAEFATFFAGLLLAGAATMWWGIGLVERIEACHRLDSLPALIHLY